MREIIYNAETKEISERDLTAAEIQERNAQAAQMSAEIATKEAARQAVLNKLGLTAEEVATLLA